MKDGLMLHARWFVIAIALLSLAVTGGAPLAAQQSGPRWIDRGNVGFSGLDCAQDAPAGGGLLGRIAGRSDEQVYEKLLWQAANDAAAQGYNWLIAGDIHDRTRTTNSSGIVYDIAVSTSTGAGLAVPRVVPGMIRKTSSRWQMACLAVDDLDVLIYLTGSAVEGQNVFNTRKVLSHLEPRFGKPRVALPPEEVLFIHRFNEQHVGRDVALERIAVLRDARSCDARHQADIDAVRRCVRQLDDRAKKAGWVQFFGADLRE
jgi:hypothetical protein